MSSGAQKTQAKGGQKQAKPKAKAGGGGGAAKQAAGAKKTTQAKGGPKKAANKPSGSGPKKATGGGGKPKAQSSGAAKSKQAGSRKAKTVQKGKDKVQKNKRKEFSSYMFRFQKPSRKIGRGGVLPKTKALGRLVRWPKYIQLQRQRKVLLQRLKVPPALNIFNAPAGRSRARSILHLFSKYKPEDKKQKKLRLRSQAKVQADKKALDTPKPCLVKFGFNHVTDLVEAGRAKLVLIAHDVDPIEIVLWLPTLCVNKDIPFAIVRGKSRLGSLVNLKTASCVALCDVRPEDEKTFKEIAEDCHNQYNKRFNYLKKKAGAKIMGIKTRHSIAKRRRFRDEEAKKRKEAQEGEKTDAK